MIQRLLGPSPGSRLCYSSLDKSACPGNVLQTPGDPAEYLQDEPIRSRCSAPLACICGPSGQCAWCHSTAQPLIAVPVQQDAERQWVLYLEKLCLYRCQLADDTPFP